MFFLVVFVSLCLCVMLIIGEKIILVAVDVLNDHVEFVLFEIIVLKN